LCSLNERQIPTLRDNRLNGPRFFKLKKIAEHLYTKFGLHVPALPPSPSASSSSSSSSTSTATTSNGPSSSPSSLSQKPKEADAHEVIDILLNDKVLSPDMTLGTMKTYLWKNSDEVKLFYRINPRFIQMVSLPLSLPREY